MYEVAVGVYQLLLVYPVAVAYHMGVNASNGGCVPSARRVPNGGSVPSGDNYQAKRWVVYKVGLVDQAAQWAMPGRRGKGDMGVDHARVRGRVPSRGTLSPPTHRRLLHYPSSSTGEWPCHLNSWSLGPQLVGKFLLVIVMFVKKDKNMAIKEGPVIYQEGHTVPSGG